MNKLIEDWKESVERLNQARASEMFALEKAEKEAKLPEKLRPAVASDIVEGAIIWYPDWRDEEHGNEPDCRLWNMVDEVMYPNDDWKAYVAHDGCRYGLYAAFVEE